MLGGQADLSERDSAGGQIEHERGVALPRRGKCKGIGAIDGRIPPERRHPGNRIHGGDGDEARFGKWLHIQPQGAEVMRVPYRRQRNTVLRRAFHQEGSGRGKRGLREAVAGVHAQKTASHRVDDGFRMAVDIPAFERVDVSRNAKEAVATGAVAVGTGDRVGQNVRHCSRCAVFLEDRGQQHLQVVECDGPAFSVLAGIRCHSIPSLEMSG
ncbi:Uncharacterised protein [Bordetella pertussis]|nr:Uncharacterised protein [Bordetella pertussis]